ncbi:hypothetical protein F511_21744 [Dorcoceras hygrometricum]|uniref:Uncharacterized protein n=1 Tax=Dorcoceras hygrometricum TaxID=472368 RepID=A0A2Z7BLK6_9LAMI|nr:hypothetical protein F511_21744 [Dorcoceras hygrometricum]
MGDLAQLNTFKAAVTPPMACPVGALNKLNCEGSGRQSRLKKWSAQVQYLPQDPLTTRCYPGNTSATDAKPLTINTQGGKSTLENCQVLQATVNRSKGNRTELSNSELIQKSAYCRVSGRDMDLLELSAYGNVRRGQDSGGSPRDPRTEHCSINPTYVSRGESNQEALVELGILDRGLATTSGISRAHAYPRTEHLRDGEEFIT